MKKLLIAVLVIAGMSLALASSSLRLVSGVGYGLVGIEYEYGLPHQNLAYSGGLGLVASDTTTGLSVVGGTTFYLDQSQDRGGLYMSLRVATAFLTIKDYSATAVMGIVSGGYRFASDRFDVGLEFGFGVATATAAGVSESGVFPALGLSIGFRP